MRHPGSLMRLLLHLLIPVRTAEAEQGLEDECSVTQEEERRAREMVIETLRAKHDQDPPATE